MDAEATDEAMQEAWAMGDANGDAQLNWDEFWNLVLMMGEKEGGEDHMSEDEWRQFFDDIGAAGYGWINRTEFGNGYRQKDPNATDAQIDEAWNMGDVNGDGQLNWDEFWMLVNMMDDGSKE